MRQSTRIVAAALLLGLGSNAWWLGVIAGDCDGLRAQAQLIADHPEVGSACESIVSIEGRRYLLMSAELRELRAEQLVLRFRGALEDTVLSAGGGQPIATDADLALPADTAVGSRLNVFVPEDRVLEVFGEACRIDQPALTVAVQRAESKEARDARIANYTACPRRYRPWYPIVDELPQTATPLPLIGLVGLGLLAVAAALARRRHARR
jgi:LPXTG-motif cell wall-anchored protein